MSYIYSGATHDFFSVHVMKQNLIQDTLLNIFYAMRLRSSSNLADLSLCNPDSAETAPPRLTEGRATTV